jgi:hypothetical protein
MFTLEQATKGVEAQIISFLNLGAGCTWVVNATPRPLHPMERPGTHYVEGWVGPRAGHDGWGIFRLPHRVSIPGLPSP